jgi:hypothetical protein
MLCLKIQHTMGGHNMNVEEVEDEEEEEEEEERLFLT